MSYGDVILDSLDDLKRVIASTTELGDSSFNLFEAGKDEQGNFSGLPISADWNSDDQRVELTDGAGNGIGFYAGSIGSDYFYGNGGGLSNIPAASLPSDLSYKSVTETISGAKTFTANQQFGGTLFKTASGTTVSVVLNGYLTTAGAPCTDFRYPNGGIFRVAEDNVAGNHDIFFQALPATTAGYGYLEAWQAAGMIVGTGNNTPVIFRTDRAERGRFASNGGNLLLNTTSDDSTNRLQVNGSAKFGLQSLNSGTTAGTIVGQLAIEAASGTNNGKLIRWNGSSWIPVG